MSPGISNHDFAEEPTKLLTAVWILQCAVARALALSIVAAELGFSSEQTRTQQKNQVVKLGEVVPNRRRAQQEQKALL